MDPTSSPAEQPAAPETPPQAAAPANSGEGVAEQYVTSELAKARTTLRNTQIYGGVGLTVLALYLGFMTFRVVGWAEPHAAAEVATGIISERVNTGAADMAEQFKERIPETIAALPDAAIKQLPELREALVARIEGDLTHYCQSSSEELGKHLDAFLKDNKTQIQTVFEAGQDREALRKVGPALEKELMSYISAPTEGGGESVKAKIDKALAMLKEMKGKTAHLATAPNLTLDELKTRRAIALISRTVNKQLRGVNVQKAVLEHADHLMSAPAPDAEETAASAAAPSTNSAAPSAMGTSPSANSAAPSATGAMGNAAH